MPQVLSGGLCSLRVCCSVQQNVVNGDDKVEKLILGLKQDVDVHVLSDILECW